MIVYDPEKILKQIAPETKIKKLISPQLGFKKSVFKTLFNADFIDKKEVQNVALKAIRSYNKRAALAGAEGTKDDEKKLEKQLATNPKLLIQRVQNAVLWQVKEEIKSKYKGELYEWLPSDANEPDPEHQLNYGEIFEIGVGEMPQDREGCRCGMRILTDDEKLEL